MYIWWTVSTQHCTITLSPLRFNVYLLLPIHVVFYCSLRLAPGCPASTLIIILIINTLLKCATAHLNMTLLGTGLTVWFWTNRTWKVNFMITEWCLGTVELKLLQNKFYGGCENILTPKYLHVKCHLTPHAKDSPTAECCCWHEVVCTTLLYLRLPLCCNRALVRVDK